MLVSLYDQWSKSWAVLFAEGIDSAVVVVSTFKFPLVYMYMYPIFRFGNVNNGKYRPVCIELSLFV